MRAIILVFILVPAAIAGALAVGGGFDEPQSRDQLTAHFREILLSAAQADFAWVEARDSLGAGYVADDDLNRALPPDDEIVVVSLNRGQFDVAFGHAFDAGMKYVIRVVMAASDAEEIARRLDLPDYRIERTGKRLRPFIRNKLPMRADDAEPMHE